MYKPASQQATSTSATSKSTEDDGIVTSATLVLPNSRSTAAATASNAVNEPLVATYTISTPTPKSVAQNFSADLNEEITATFTISTPTPTLTTTTKKTDLEVLPTKASPTTVNSFNFTKSNMVENSANQKLLGADKVATSASTVTTAATETSHSLDNDRQPSTALTKDCLQRSAANPTSFSTFNSYSDDFYNITLTDDDKNDKINTAAAAAAGNKAAIHKRSLFDIDNASSLSLADKLRNEANKYSDDSAGRDNFGSNKNALNLTETDKTKKTGTSPTSPTSYHPTMTNVASTSTACTTTASVVNSHTSVVNERRPSWRLKLDAGCKVCLRFARPPNDATLIL